MNIFLISLSLMCSGLFVGEQLCLSISKFIENEKKARTIAYLLIPISVAMIVLLTIPNTSVNYHYFFIGLPIYPANYKRLYTTRKV